MVKSREELATVKMNLNLLRCSVCLGELRHPIYDCVYGHALCSLCRSKKCPKCNGSIRSSRNLVLKSIIETIHINCSYSAFGCDENIPLLKKDFHERHCSFGPCSCPIETCEFKSPATNLSDHIKRHHPLAAGESFEYDKWFSVSVKKGSPFCLMHGSDDQVFLLLVDGYTNVGSAFKLSVAFLLPGFQEKSFDYELSVSGDGNKVSLVSRAEHIREWKRGLPMEACLFVPAQISRRFASGTEVRVCIKSSREIEQQSSDDDDVDDDDDDGDATGDGGDKDGGLRPE